MTVLQREFGPTVDDLVEVARAAGKSEASRRTIRHWVSEGLVSRPARHGRQWRYPIRAIGEVDAVTRWRERGATLEETRFVVFIETGGGNAEAAVRIAREFLEAWEQSIAAAAADAQANPAVLQQEAAKAARMRSRSPLPHRVRGVSFDERELAIAFVMGEMLGLPRDPDIAAEGLFHLERIFGMRSGRGGADRDVSEVSVKPGDLAPNPTDLRRALERATPERIEFARRGVDAALIWMPALRATLASEFGAAAAPVVDIAVEWTDKMTPHVYALMFAIFTRNAFERATDAQITESLRVFDGPLMTAAILAERPPSERDAALRLLRPYQRILLERAPARPDEDAA
jgi:DNA-binding transcriptional MerR regulator